MDELLPDGLYYENHSWVKLGGDIASVGIDKPYADSSKEFAFIELPKLGPIEKGEKYVSMESVKGSGHMDSPVKGEIIEVNEKLFDNPAAINGNPYDAWIMKVKVNPDDVKKLTDAEAAKKNLVCQVKL